MLVIVHLALRFQLLICRCAPCNNGIYNSAVTVAVAVTGCMQMSIAEHYYKLGIAFPTAAPVARRMQMSLERAHPTWEPKAESS